MIKRTLSLFLILSFLFTGFFAITIPYQGMNDKVKDSENKSDSVRTEIVAQNSGESQNLNTEDKNSKSMKPNISVSVMLYLIYKITHKSIQ